MYFVVFIDYISLQYIVSMSYRWVIVNNPQLFMLRYSPLITCGTLEIKFFIVMNNLSQI